MSSCFLSLLEPKELVLNFSAQHNHQRFVASRQVSRTGRTEAAAQIRSCNQFVVSTVTGHRLGSSRTASSFSFDCSNP